MTQHVRRNQAAFAFGGLVSIVTAFVVAIKVAAAVVAAMLSPIGLLVAAIAGIGTVILVSTGAGGKALAWLSSKFTELKNFAGKAWKGIGDALAAGDIALTSEEFNTLLEAARNSSKKAQGVDGPTRAMIYLTAALTGLRRKELASLTRADFRMDDPMPLVRIQGAYSKNKKTDEIPLHPKVVAQLQDYFDRTQPEEGQPVFPLRAPGGDLRPTSKMMKADLDAARAAWLKEAKDNPEELKERQKSDFLKYSSSDGFADFHANRVLFVTSLCRSNVGLVTAQKLARHSDPKLTANIYSKITTDERAAAINGISLES